VFANITSANIGYEFIMKILTVLNTYVTLSTYVNKIVKYCDHFNYFYIEFILHTNRWWVLGQELKKILCTYVHSGHLFKMGYLGIL
jgi:hypothetical protein